MAILCRHVGNLAIFNSNFSKIARYSLGFYDFLLFIWLFLGKRLPLQPYKYYKV